MATNLVSLVRKLQQRKARKRQRLATVEGIRLVEEALASGVRFRGALAVPRLAESGRGASLLRDLAAHAVPLEEIPERALLSLADTETPQGILAVIEPPRWSVSEIEPGVGSPVLVLDGVQDPGNVGTMLRTAHALGGAGAILLKGTADLTNSKLVRAGMGATFRFPTALAEDGEFSSWVAARSVTVWVAAAQGTQLERLSPPERLAVVIGNEGTGVRSALKALAAETVAIPLARGVESLNAAVAAGIILYEVSRER